MAEEAVETKTESTEEHQTETSQESVSALPGLFDDEVEFPSEEDLTGGEETEDEAPEPDPEKKESTEKPSSEKAEPSDPKDEKKEDPEKPDADSKEEKPDKPPEGFVPKQALDEERHKRQSLSSEVYQLKQKLAAVESGKAKPEKSESEDDFKDFKVLSQKEYEEMVEDDPFEGSKYLYRLQQYKEHQSAKQAAESRKEETESMRKQIIQDSYEEIGSVAPGIWDQATGVAKALTETAEKFGVSRQVAGVLSNPGTLIVDPESGQQVVLGSGAAEFVKLVKGLSENNPEAIRKQVEKEVTERVTAEVTKELTRKFKSGSAGITSLGDASLHSEQVSGDIPTNEDEWVKLSDEDRRKALGG